MIFYNSENNIRDRRPFCRPMFCHSSVVKYIILYPSCSSEAVMRLDYQILLKPPPLTLLARSAPDLHSFLTYSMCIALLNA